MSRAGTTAKFAILVTVGVLAVHEMFGGPGVAAFGLGLGSMLLFSVVVDLIFHVFGWRDK